MNNPKNSENSLADSRRELAALCANWPTLRPMERSDQLRTLVDKGYFRRDLGRRLNCSESLIRQLLKLQGLTEEEKKAVNKGLLSMRAALRRMEALKIPVGNS